MKVTKSQAPIHTSPVCQNIFMWMWGLHMCGDMYAWICICVETRGQPQMFLLRSPPPLFFWVRFPSWSDTCHLSWLFTWDLGIDLLVLCHCECSSQVFCLLWDSVSLCSPGCPTTYCVNQACRNPLAPASKMLGLKACITVPSLVTLGSNTSQSATVNWVITIWLSQTHVRCRYRMTV